MKKRGNKYHTVMEIRVTMPDDVLEFIEIVKAIRSVKKPKPRKKK